MSFMRDYMERKRKFNADRKRGFGLFTWFFIITLVLGLASCGTFGYFTYQCYQGDNQACKVAELLKPDHDD